MGQISWCPKLQEAVRDKIEYFSLSGRHKLGRKVSANILWRLSKKTGLCIVVNLIEAEMTDIIDKLYKECRELKKCHEKHREEFLTGLAEALE